MFNINLSTDYDRLTDYILTAHLDDYADRSMSAEDKGWHVDKTCKYLTVEDEEGKILTVAKYSYMTEVAIDFHIYVDPALWGTGQADKIEAALMDWYKDNTAINSVVTFCPASCKEVHRAADRVGYAPVGIIPFGIIWKNKVEDIYIFNKVIWRI